MCDLTVTGMPMKIAGLSLFGLVLITGCATLGEILVQQPAPKVEPKTSAVALGPERAHVQD